MTFLSAAPLRRLLVIAALAVLALAFSGQAGAANGDNLRTIIIDRTGTACASYNAAGNHSSVGVGVAFDGTNLLASCYSDNTITAVSPLDGSKVVIHPITGASSLGALAWDNGRSVVWGCSSFSGVGTIDLTTNSFTYKFSSYGCFDGLAYDASDDTIWASGDGAGSVQHWTVTGGLISTTSISGKIGGCGNSGIAVGGPKLYLANNGCSQIYEVAKDFSTSTLFASFPRRIEDMECDNVSFASSGKGAIWSIDAYDNVLNAWEIPAGSCSFGGGGGGGGDKPISASGYPVSAVEGAPFSGAVATVTDPGPAATAAEYTASIDWGDSSSSAGTVSGPTGGPFTVSGTHTYGEEGSYTVTTTVTDVDTPSNTATATSAATVADAAIAASCSMPALSGLSFSGATSGLSDANLGGSVADFTASINWGDSSSSAGTVGGSGGSYTVSGSHTYSSTGSFTITTSIADVGGSTASTTCTTLVYAFAPGGGSFVVGDKTATGSVMFWGAQWWKQNVLTGGAAPAAFKGFAKNPSVPACGTDWSTDPGNSAPPPAGPLPAYMAVIVSSSISKSGSQISGNTVHIVIVKTNAGYDSNPGHAGTGLVVATVC